MISHPPSSNKAPQQFARNLALAVQVPFTLLAGVAIGGGAGYLLDRWWHTRPWLTVALMIAGFAGAMWEVFRQVQAEEKREQSDNRGH